MSFTAGNISLLPFVVTILFLLYSGSGRDYLFPSSELPACQQLEAGLTIRPLAREDYNAGFLQLLSQLTSVGEVGTWVLATILLVSVSVSLILVTAGVPR